MTDSSYDNDRVVPNIPGEPIDLTGVTVSAPPGFKGTFRLSNNWPLSEAVSGKVWVLFHSEDLADSPSHPIGVFTSLHFAEAEKKRWEDVGDQGAVYEIEEFELNKPIPIFVEKRSRYKGQTK